MKVTFKGMCVRKWDTGLGREEVAPRAESEMSGGDENWNSGEDNRVITNVLPVYFLPSPVKPSHSQQHLLSFRLKHKTDVGSFQLCVNPR